MDDILRQVLDYARGVWQRRWAGLMVAWLVALIGCILVLRMPPQYEASARVYVDTASVLPELMRGITTSLGTDQQISLLSRTLISRPNIEKVVRKADLDLGAKSPEERDRLIESLMKRIQLASASRDARDNLYVIGFRDGNPAEAKRVVQEVLSMFVELSLTDKRKENDTAQNFIQDQIKIYEKRLEEAENKVKEFKLRNMGIVGAQGGDYFNRMTSLGEELARARLELRAAEESRDALKKELAGETAVFLPESNSSGSFDSGPLAAIPEIDTRLDTLKRQLDELQRRYTDQHPDVSNTKRIIGELEVQRKQETEARAKAATARAAGATPNSGSSMGAASRNPVFQQIKVALAESEANVASLRARAAELDSRYNKLRASAQRLPEVEAEYAQLTRDFDVQKRQYDQLVSRRETASLSRDMETAGVAEIRVIEPPRVSQEPVAPNRPLLMVAALIAGLGAGLAISFLYSQVAPTFNDSRALADLIKRPVLGTVSLIQRPEFMRKRRRGAWLFLTGLAGLFGSWGAAMILMFVVGKPLF